MGKTLKNPKSAGKLSVPKVLVVDDEQDNVDLIYRVLRPNFDVKTTTSAREAANLLTSEPFDLIFADQRMPEMSGAEVLERARELQPWARRIIISGYTDPSELLSAINRGRIHRFIAKPLSIDELLECASSFTEELAERARTASAPRAKGLPFLGVAPKLWSNPLKCLLEAARGQGDVVHLGDVPVKMYLLAHPAHVQHVLIDNVHNYPMGEMRSERLKLVFGDGIVTSEGELWKHRRGLIQPAFSPQGLSSLTGTMVAEASSACQRWRAWAGSQESFDLTVEAKNIAGGILQKSLFGADFAPTDTQAIGEALHSGTAALLNRVFSPVNLPEAIPTPNMRRLHKALAVFDDLIYETIAERRKDPRDRGDLLSMLFSAKDEKTGEGLNDKALRDEVMSLLSAGIDTSASLIVWAFCNLSRFPATRDALQREVDTVLGGRLPTLEDLPKLAYTRMVLSETLRLYPPGWLIPRTVVADDVIGGYRIPAGATVAVSPYVGHHDPRFWPNPLGFDPRRFDPELNTERPRFAYFPFSGGQRQCIGNHFAPMAVTVVLALLTQKFVVDVEPGQSLEPVAHVTLQPPRGGLFVRVSQRN